MTSIKGTHVTFNKADLAHLDDGQLQIICVFPQITNRLAVLEAQAYSHMNVLQDESKEQLKREAAVCGCLESLILIAGELKEAWMAIQKCYYGTKLARTMNSTLPVPIQESLKRCGSHFSGDSLVSFLRNNLAYHNCPSLALDAMKAAPDHEKMGFHVLDPSSCYFDYATRIRLSAIANKLGVENAEDIFDPLMQRVLGDVLNDVYLPMMVIAHNILLTVNHERREIEPIDVPGEMDLRADVFFDPRLSEDSL